MNYASITRYLFILAHIEANSCVRIRPATSYDRYTLKIVNHQALNETGCFAYVLLNVQRFNGSEIHLNERRCYVSSLGSWH